MSKPTINELRIVPTTPVVALPGQPDLVMAWARLADTGTLVHILELNESQRGRACGCTCISCADLVIAVNAAKRRFKKRPHFRHQKGVHSDACLVIAAREALRQNFHEGDVIRLPKLVRSANVIGLSGAEYTAWFELPPEEVKVRAIRLVDPLAARLVLDDGREIDVQLTGSSDHTADDALVARVLISLGDDPAIAGLSADEIRRRLIPAIEGASWCGHWRDEEAALYALSLAEQKALEALDWCDEADGDLPPDLRRESLLHREVKAMLEQTRKLLVPGWIALSPDHMFQITSVILEKKLGRVIPDVVARLDDGTELLVEVTVSNTITHERIGRIAEVGIKALEIDLSSMGGVLTRAQLREIVTEKTVGKRWLYHPATDRGALSVPDLPNRAPAPLTLPAWHTTRSLEELSECFLDAFMTMADLEAAQKPGDHVVDLIEIARGQMYEASKAMAAYGLPRIEDTPLVGGSNRVLTRLLSIKYDRAIGYEIRTSWQVINTILGDSVLHATRWHVIYLMAVDVYAPTLNPAQKARVAQWRQDVIASVQAGERKYLRVTTYDDLIGALFPELLLKLQSRFAVAKNSLAPEYFSGGKEQRWMWTKAIFDSALSRERRAAEPGSVESVILRSIAPSSQVQDPWALALAIEKTHRIPKAVSLQFFYDHGYSAPC